jgi:hypothetical protein
LTENVLGYTLGDFFKNSAGHPDGSSKVHLDKKAPNFHLIAQLKIILERSTF